MLRITFVFGIIFIGAYFALRAPFYALLFYLWNAYFRPEAWVWSDLIARLDLSFWIGLFLVASFLASAKEIRLDRRMAICLLFLIDSLFSTVFSQAPTISWAYWVEFSKIFLITYFLVELVTDLSRLRITLLVIALSLGLEGAKQGWLGMIRNPGAPNDNPVPFLGNNNDVATGMLMLVPMFGILAATARSKWEKWPYCILLVGVLYRGLSTYSRSGFLAAIALGVIYLVRARRRAIAIASMVVVAVGLSLFLSSGYWQRMGTITEGTETKDTSALSRLHYWETAIRMGANHPLVGCGFHAFEECYDRYDSTNGEYGHRRAAHSTWFAVLAEQGYIGIGIYVAIFGSAVLSCRRVRRMARASGDRRTEPYAAGLEASLWAFAVGGSFHSFQYNEMAWHLVGLTIALERITSQRALKLGSIGTPPAEARQSFAQAVAFGTGSP